MNWAQRGYDLAEKHGSNLDHDALTKALDIGLMRFSDNKGFLFGSVTWLNSALTSMADAGCTFRIGGEIVDVDDLFLALEGAMNRVEMDPVREKLAVAMSLLQTAAKAGITSFRLVPKPETEPAPLKIEIVATPKSVTEIERDDNLEITKVTKFDLIE